MNRYVDERRSDGLIARESGDWAEHKLYYLERYLDAFNTAIKHVFPRRVYIDLLAGPGRCFLKQNQSTEFDGSPVRALKCPEPFSDHLFVEGDPNCAAALRIRLNTIQAGAGEKVVNADANAPETIARIRECLDGFGTLGLIFVDTLGLSDVSFETLKAITKDRRADLIYVFHEQDVTRNMNEALMSETEAARWTNSFGTSDWAMAWLAHRRGISGTVSVADALTTFFERQLHEGLGYSHVAALHRPMKNTKNAPLYRLILAAHHERALGLWRGISAIEYGGQRGFSF